MGVVLRDQNYAIYAKTAHVPFNTRTRAITDVELLPVAALAGFAAPVLSGCCV